MYIFILLLFCVLITYNHLAHKYAKWATHSLQSSQDSRHVRGPPVYPKVRSPAQHAHEGGRHGGGVARVGHDVGGAALRGARVEHVHGERGAAARGVQPPQRARQPRRAAVQRHQAPGAALQPHSRLNRPIH